LKNLKVEENLDLEFIIKKTEGYSGADITNLCREAAYMPMRKKLKSEGGFKNIGDMKKF
jgi:SpoVK/Ycf46/Vps4 family AAA+-type ATPase